MILRTHNRPQLTLVAIVMAMMCFGAEWGHSQGVTYFQSVFGRKSASSEKSGSKPTATDKLGPSVQEIHRLATQMAWQVGYEITRNKDAGKELSAIHSEMRKYSALTANLLKTYKGKSAKDFETSAVEVRKALLKVKQLCDKEEVNANVAQMVKRSESISTFISEHRGSFKPK